MTSLTDDLWYNDIPYVSSDTATNFSKFHSRLTVMLRHKHICTQSLFRAGRISEARMEAVTLVKLKPDWSQGYQRLGEALLALQEYEEAEAVHLLYLSL